MAQPENYPVYHLDPENELRIVVSEEASDFSVELTHGLAEIFGTEMVLNKVYNFPPSSTIAVFTWQGCELKLQGNTEQCDIVKDTLMIIPVSLHACLEKMRIKAETENKKGPVSLIVGPMDIGKSTLCRLLLNYAARLGRKPVFIDLDVGQNSISIPGSIGILPINKPADAVEGFAQQAVSVYHFGYKSPGHNIALYFLLIQKLGEILRTRMTRSSNKNYSGVIIDTCGWVRGLGYHSLTLAALAFEIDVVFVLDEDRLYQQLKQDMPNCVQVVYVPKFSAVYERDRSLRIKIRDNKVSEYFYGSRKLLNPHLFDVNFSDIQIFKVSAPHVDENSESVNVSREDLDVERVSLGHHLKGQVLAVSYADSLEEDIIFSYIIGYISVTNVDMTREVITVLSPQPSPLPKKILLMGDIRLLQ